MDHLSGIETPRLLLRPVTPDDFDFYFSLQRDPVAMRYIRPPDSDPEVARKRLNDIMAYTDKQPGLGAFVAEWKTTGVPVGNGVVRHVDYNPENDLEIGYLVVQEFWGRGLATEMAQAFTEYAFRQFQAPRVVAVVDPENGASQRVLLKSGFVQVGRRFIYGSDNLEFVRERG